MNSDKNKRISDTMRQTYEKRSHQRCRVFECKVNASRLNASQKEKLKMIFIEAKWCYNYLLNRMEDKSFDIFSFDSKNLSAITHKDKDGNDVPVVLSNITSSLKADLVSKLCSSIKTLHSLKKKKKKVGRIKFKSEYNSIGLKQLGITHTVVSKNRIKVQGIKKPLPVNGLSQMDEYGSYELANALLHRCGEDYYIYLTAYYDKESEFKNRNKICNGKKNEEMGIDFGCQTALTLSDGTKMNAVVEESGRLKHLQRKMRKQTKGSNNRWRTRLKIQREYRRLSNVKNDLANKTVHNLLENNVLIVMQDEQINLWKVKHGKKIQHGILGRVKTRLNEHPERVVVLDRFIPTTKFCPECGNTHKDITLYDRTYVCPVCGAVSDRDVHAARNMVWIYDNMIKGKIGPGGSELKRADFDEEVRNLFPDGIIEG